MQLGGASPPETLNKLEALRVEVGSDKLKLKMEDGEVEKHTLDALILNRNTLV